MIMKRENGYLRIGWNGYSRNTHHRVGCHSMSAEGCLHQSSLQSLLSRITEPIRQKHLLSPLKLVRDGRSIHSPPHSIPLFKLNVFFQMYSLSRIVFRSSPLSPARANLSSWMDCNEPKSESSIHTIPYSQTQPNDKRRRHTHQV